MVFGYKELALKLLGKEVCELCGNKENLTIVNLEENPKVFCQTCAEKNGHREENVCDAHMTQNNQVTINLDIRGKLNIEPKDLVFIKVLKVISPNGDIKHGG